MNLRHAAALALVGWYLMVPPVKPTYTWSDDVHYWLDRLPGLLSPGQTPFIASAKCVPDVPLSEWKQSDEFESLPACKAAAEKAEASTRREIDMVEKALEEATVPSSAGKPSEGEKQTDEQEIICADMRSASRLTIHASKGIEIV